MRTPKPKPYKKIDKGHPEYYRVAFSRKAGVFFCDSEDHNAPGGCSNQHCFSHNKTKTKT